MNTAMERELPQICHLHSHWYSHDSMTVFNEIAEEIAKEFKVLACTDHGTLNGIVDFVTTCKKVGIKPIVGNEFYIMLSASDEKVYHITVLAQNYEGYKNLVKLNNIAKFRGSKSSRRRSHHVIYLDELLEYNENLIVLSGCPNSPMQELSPNEALLVASKIKNIYKDRFYIEAMLLQNDSHLLRAKWLSEQLDVKLVITNDSHFHKQEYAPLHVKFLNIIQAFSYDSSFNFLATTAQLMARANKLYPHHIKLIEDGILVTHEIAARITDFDFNATPKLPHINDAENMLTEVALECFQKSDLWKQTNYCERFLFEINTINDSGYAAYFLITKELIDVAKQNGYLIGIGRGSAAGSLVCFLLGITGVDPIKYDLLFERFINPERIELPDIDTDIPSQARQLVIEYANSKYGALQIAAYDTWGLRSILNKFAKFFSLDEKLVKLANDAAEPVASKTKADYLDDPNYTALAATNKDFATLVNIIYGQIKNISRHAGGVVTLENSDDIPFETAPDGTLVVAYGEGVKTKYLAQVGGVKFDLLGLSALDILQELLRTTGVDADEPSDNDPVFSLFQTGKTAGIFQFNGFGNIEFTKQIHPTSFADLVAINALYRKGTLLGGTADYYKETRRTGKIRSLHPEIDEILKDTYGCLVYQEDIMRLYAWACDKSFGAADFARKALTKYKAGVPEKEALLLKLKKEMYAGMTAKGLDAKIQDTLWHEMVAHSLYSFNKSHATAYAMIAWRMAWYKYHYPLYFAAAALNFRNDDEKQEFIFNLASEGYEIKPPDVNVSTLDYTTDGVSLFMPLNSIHGVGDTAAAKIIEMRPYNSYTDLVTKTPRRSVTRAVLRAFYQIGALNKFTDDPKVLKLLEEEYVVLTHREIQKRYFKKTQLPTPSIMKKVNLANLQDDMVGGCVIRKEMRVSKNGNNYWLHIIAPNGMVITYKDLLQEGDWFRAKTNKTYKKSLIEGTIEIL